MRRIGLVFVAACCCVALCGCAGWHKLFSSDETSDVVASATVQASVPPVSITVEGGSAEVGDTVILPVTVNTDACLVDADILLRYDSALLEPVLQYDAATDSERYAEPGTFNGTIRSEKTEDGCVYVLLAATDEGTQAEGTLFYVAFRLLSDKEANVTVTPEVPSCHVQVDAADADAVAAGALTLKAGTVIPKAAEATEKQEPTATETAAAIS